MSAPPDRPSQKRHLGIAAAVGVAVLLGALVWLSTRASSQTGSATAGGDATTGTATGPAPGATDRPGATDKPVASGRPGATDKPVANGRPQGPGPSPAGSAGIDVGLMAGAGAERARETLKHYLEFSKFPPWSRPADGAQQHVWEWNKLDATGQAIGVDPTGKTISAELKLDPAFAAPGETITATVTVWRGAYEEQGAGREPADAKIAGSIDVFRDRKATTPPAGYVSEDGYETVENLFFSPVAGGPGHRYVAKITPSSLAGLKTQRDARCSAMVTVGNDSTRLAAPLRYAVTAPLVVLERSTDAIVRGSLEVTVGFDIKKVGPVMVQATLFDPKGTTPIAIYDDFYRPTELGPQEVKITFFGKVIAEKGIDGPYIVRALHGFVQTSDSDPPEVFWAAKKPIATATYKASEFSGNDWDGPEKQTQIEQYNKLIEGFESGEL